jgi:hypothetical protein
MALELAVSTLLSPIVLFFVLGLVAALARSEMSVPESFAKGIAIYLMMAIGLKGGFAMAESGLSIALVAVLAAGVLLSFALPLVAYPLLRATTGLGRIDAAATAAHYGSISIVTFVAASQAVEYADLATSGSLVAVAAVMEAPAIVTALLLAGRARRRGDPVAGSERGDLLREVALNASVVVLIGGLLIGWISGEPGREQVGAFFLTPLQGVLCLFLLDMGLSAGRGLRQGWRSLGPATIAFGLYMPLIGAVAAAISGRILGLTAGDAALLTTLAASASYIAVPAAMRLALPKARPSIYLTLSLGVTFPFNLTLGIPLYVVVGQWVGG